MKLTGAQFGVLLDEIAGAYQPYDFRILIRTKLEVEIEKMGPGGNGFMDQVYNLITVFENEGKTSSLIEAILEHRPKRKDLQEKLSVLLADLQGRESVSREPSCPATPFRRKRKPIPPSAEPWTDLVLGVRPKLPFINRFTFRRNLKALVDPKSNYKILSLLGQKGCGKSYSWPFLEHVARSRGIAAVYLDISMGYPLDEACETLTRQMDLNVADMGLNVLVDNATRDRIGRKFARWLARVTYDRRPKKWWLVVDGLDEADGPSIDLRDNLVQWLIKTLRSDINFSQVVLVLLGASATTDAILTPHTLEEQLEVLSPNHVVTYILEYIKAENLALRPQEIADVITGACGENVGGVMDMRRMSRTMTLLINEVLDKERAK